MIEKEWMDANPSFQLPQDVYVEVECDNNYYDSAWIHPEKDGVFEIKPHWDGTSCEVYEEERAGFISDLSDCDGLSLSPGSGDGCTIVNTRLYEGIPTLCQYSLGILALLMLAVGAVGFRRYA